MELRYAGTCKVCGGAVAKGALAFYDSVARTVTCHGIECCDKDGLTTIESLSGPWDKRTDTRVRTERRIGDSYYDPFAKSRSRGYYGRDAVRCEDAPCCGCC